MIKGLFNQIGEWQGDACHRPYEKIMSCRGEPCVRPVTNNEIKFPHQINKTQWKETSDPARQVHLLGQDSPSPTKNQSTVEATTRVALPQNPNKNCLKKGVFYV
jgi:hypothetical protein